MFTGYSTLHQTSDEDRLYMCLEKQTSYVRSIYVLYPGEEVYIHWNNE